jgi:hypothetical protein
LEAAYEGSPTSSHSSNALDLTFIGDYAYAQHGPVIQKSRLARAPGVADLRRSAVKRAILTLPLITFLGGCASMVLTGGGTEVFEFFSPKYDAPKIRSLFPAVEKSVPFPSPRKASSIPEMQESLGWWRQYSKIPDAELWGYEEYTFRGWIKDSEVWQGLGMVDGLTLGMGGWFFGKDIAHTKAEESARVRTFRIWYDSQQHYFCHQEVFDSNWDKYHWPPHLVARTKTLFTFYGRK